MDDRIRAHLATLEAAPGDVAAFRALEAIYREDGRVEELIGLYETRARLLGPVEASPLFGQAAELARQAFRSTVRAEELYRAQLNVEPDHQGALAALAELAEEREDWPALATVLERSEAAARSSAQGAQVALRLGRLFEEKLGRRDRAALHYGLAARLAPSLEEARQRALDACIALRRFAQAKRMLDSARIAGAEATSLAASYTRLGAALAGEALFHDVAMDALVEAQSLDRSTPGAAQARERLGALPRRWREEAVALEAQIGPVPRADAADLLLRVAQLHGAYDPDGLQKAVERLTRAWSLVPGHPAVLELLERLHAERRDYGALAAALERLAAATRDRGALVQIHLARAQLRLVRQADPAGGLACWLEALAADPACEPAALQVFERRVDAGQFGEALDGLERHLAAAPGKPGHAPLQVRAAEIAAGRLGDAARARRFLDGALRSDPGHVPAAAAVAPLLAEAGDWGRYVEVLALRASAEPDAGERARILEKIGTAELRQLDRPRDAFRTLSRSLAQEPRRASVRLALEEAARRASLLPELCRALRAAAEVVADDPPLQKALLRKVAEVLDQDVGRAEEAAAAWRGVTALDPADREAAAALAACETKAQARMVQGARLEAEYAAASGPGRRAPGEALARMAMELDRPDRAADVWRELLVAAPTDPSVLWGLHGALEAMAGPRSAEERVGILSRLAALASGPAERAELELERATLLAEALSRPGEAAGAAVAVLTTGGLTGPQQQRAVALLERLLARGMDPLRIARVLAPVHAARDEPEKQVAMLELMARKIPGGGDPRERARHLLDASSIRATRLGDARGALTDAGQALRACPDHAEARRRCEQLAKEVGAHGELYALLDEAARRLEGRPEDELTLRRRAAAVAEEELGASDDAAAQLRRCLELHPGEPALLADLTRIALAAERWPEAADLLAQRAAAAEGGDKASLMGQLANLVAERLQDPVRAGQLHREALALAAPEHRPRILGRLAAVLGEAGDVTGQADALAALAAVTADPAEAARLSRQSARLAAGQGDQASAVARFASALQSSPSDDAAVQALEEALAEGPDEITLAAAQALAPAYAARNDARGRARALTAQARHLAQPAERAAAWREVAQLQEQALASPGEALQAALQALRLAPGDAAARREARRLAEAAREPELALRALEAAALELPSEERPAALRELAEWLERRLEDRDRAAATWEQVRQQHPDDPAALAALRRLHRAAERWPQLLEICHALARLAGSAAARLDPLREVAAVCEARLDDAPAAVAAWREVLAQAPEDAEAVEALDRLLLRLDRPAELAGLLGERLRRGFDAEVAWRLGELRRTRLEDPSGALELLAEVARREPSHPGARTALLALATLPGGPGREALAAADAALRTAGDHRARAEARQARLAVADDPAERARLHAELRGILERELGDLPAALASARRAFEEGGPGREEAEAELRRLGEATGQLVQLAEAYQAVAAQGPRPEDWLRRAARLRTEALRDAPESIAAWRRLLDLLPDDLEALEELERLYAGAQAGRERLEVALRRAAAAPQAERVPALCHASEIALLVGDLEVEIRALGEARAIAPRDPEVLGSLEEALGRAGRADAQAEVLADLAAVTGQTDPAGRQFLLLRRAGLLEQAADPGAAVEAYAAILSEWPRDAGAVAGLERLLGRADAAPLAGRLLEDVHRLAGDPGRLATLLEHRLAGAAPGARAELLGEISGLHERAGDAAAAFSARRRAFEAAMEGGQDDLAGRAELERLAGAAEAWAELAQVYEAAAARRPAAWADLGRRLAGIYGDRLGDLERAAGWWDALAAALPGPEPLAGLVRVRRRQGAKRELAAALERLSDATPAPAARKELLFEVAKIMDEQLADREGAIAAFRKILAVDPEDPNALRLLGRLLGTAERWEELTGVLEREAAAAEARPETAAEAAELRFRLGRIHQTRLSDAAGALAAYRAALQKAPRHPATLAALEDLARGAGPVALQAAQVLEPVYAAAGDHAKVAEVLEARIQNEPEPAARAALLRQLAARQATGLRNLEAAFLAAGRALATDPESPESFSMAVQLGGQGGQGAALAALLGENLGRVHAAPARAGYLRVLARLAPDPARAAEAWQALIEVEPEDREATVGLLAALRAGGDPELMEKALRRALALEERADARARLLAELATLQEERLADAPGAVVTLKRLLELDPSQREALARLDRLCVAGERWVELADVLSREVLAAQATHDEAALLDFRQRLAELKDSRLHDRDGAVALYEEVLAVRPDHPEALARLEAMLARDPANGRAAQLLETAYAATGNYGRQAVALEARASERPDPMERKALWLDLADLREQQLRDPEMAFLALCRAFREDPADREVRRRLERLAASGGHQEELSALYQDELERLPPIPMAEVAIVLGHLHEGPLDDAAAAAGYFRRAMALVPEAAAVALPSLDRLYQRLESWPELADVLRAQAEAAGGADRVQLLYRLGRLGEERLSAPDRAAEAYETALAVDPGHLPSLQALEALYETAGRKEDLHRNLAAQGAVTLDAAAKERLLAKQAALSAELERPEEAVALWRELLSVRPRHEAALAALEALLEQGEQWSELAAHLRLRLSASVDRREVARLNDKLGWVQGAKLGDRTQAIASYKAVLDSDPRNRRALEALRDIYAAQGDVESLAGAYRRLVPLQEDAAGVKQVRLELADVLLRAGQKTEAIEQAKRAFDIEPHTPDDLVRIEQVFGAAGAAGDGVRAAEARAALLAAKGGPAEAVPAWLAVADLWRGQKRPDAAAAALEKVLELDPGCRPAYLQLRELHAHGGNWRAFARACDAYAGQQKDPAEKLAILKEVAGVHEKRLGQKEMAFLAWCRALAEGPGDEEALAESERLARETQASEELAAVLEQVAEDSRGMVRARLLLHLGALRDGVLDDAEGAEAAFRKALEADPASPEALDALTALFKKRGRVRDLIITLEQKLEAAAGLDEKKALLLELSRLYDEALDDVDEAVAAVRRILDLDGGDAQAIEALAALYRREHRWGELAGVLARARDLAADEPSRIAWQLQIAGLYESEIGDDEAAVEGYRTVLGLDDRDVPALAGLERLYTKLDRFAELNRVYERQVQLTADPNEQVRILAKSAGIFEEKMQDLARAVAQNEAILSLDGANHGAIQALTRLYRQQGQFDRLIIVMQHHLSLVQDRREQVGLLVAIGEVWWKEMARVDRAEQMFDQALQLDPESRQAVSALARLYERSGNWNLALDMLKREARLAGASHDAVDLYVRIGAIDEEMLLDLAASREAYGKALALDPGCLPAIRALKGLHERGQDREGFLEMLVAEARYAEDDAKKAELFTEVGRIHQEEREDRDGAARAYEEALKRAPEHLPAARPLADLYVAAQRWPDAERVLDGMVRTLSGGGDARELCRQSYRQGYVAEKLGNRQKALQAYQRSYELDATYLPALEGLGNLLVAEGQLEEALKIFTAIIIHHRDGLSDLEVVETHWQIGEIAARLDQPERAVGSFKKALEIDQGHVPSRQGLVRLLDAAGDHEGAVEQRQRLLPTLEGRARFEMYAAIGKACREQLQDPYQAIDAYLGASRLDPTDLPVTEALLALYRETRQGQKAADVLGQIIARPEVQADPPRAAKLHLLLAEILRDEVKDEAGALAQFERALDQNPRLPQAFAAIEEAHAKARRWPELEQAYVRMIQRLPKSPDAAQARLALWRTLGELYRNVLKDEAGARTAYQVVSRADPDDAVSIEIFADLAARSPGQEGEAIEACRRLVQLGAKPQKALSMLIGLHAGRKAYDRAYSAAQVLAHLTGGASAEELAVVGRLRKYARDQANRSLDDQAWGRLFHERIRGPLVEIMMLLAEHAAPMFTQTPKELGINVKKEELDVAGSMLFFVNMFKYVERTLAVEPVRLFKREEETPRLQLVPTDPPGLVASADAFRDRPKKELWFSIGKALAFKRPELFLARLMPHDQLEVVFQAACSAGTSRFVVTADPHQVAKVKRELERILPEPVRVNALKLLARGYTEVQQPGDVRAYLDAAELTSNRVATLLCADLETARRAVLAERPQVSKLRDETKLRDLSNFCISEDYAALREQLGLAAVVPA